VSVRARKVVCERVGVWDGLVTLHDTRSINILGLGWSFGGLCRWSLSTYPSSSVCNARFGVYRPIQIFYFAFLFGHCRCVYAGTDHKKLEKRVYST
jgi:hypothetical protein